MVLVVGLDFLITYYRLFNTYFVYRDFSYPINVRETYQHNVYYLR